MSRFIGLSRGIVLTWLILEQEFGLLQVAISFTTVFMPFCCAGLTEGVFRFAPRYENTSQWAAFFKKAAAITTVIALSTTALLASISGLIGPLLFQSRIMSSEPATSNVITEPSPQSLFLAVLLCTLSLVLHHFIQNIHKALRRFRTLGMMEITAAGVFTLLALIIASTPYATAINLLHCYTLGSLASAIIFAIPVLRMSRESTNTDDDFDKTPPPMIETGALLKFSTFAAVALVTLQSLNYLPFWFLNKAVGSAAAGSLFAVRLITQFIQILSILLTGVVASHVTRIWETETREAARSRLKLATKSSLLVMLLFGGVLSLAKPMLMNIFPDSYAHGALGFDPLLSFFLLGSVVYLLVVNLNLLERTDLTVVIWGVGALVNIALALILLKPGTPSPVPIDPGQYIRLAAWAGVGGMAASVITVFIVLRWCDAWLDSAMLWIAVLALTPNGGPWITAGMLVIVLLSLVLPVGLYSRAERTAVRGELRNYASLVRGFLRRGDSR